MDRHDVSGVDRTDAREVNLVNWEDSEDVFTPPTKPKPDFLGEIQHFGSLPPGDLSVFIERSARQMLIHESAADTSREHGGVLLGEAFKDADSGYYVVVREVIAAQQTEGSPVHLRFQYDSWHHVWNRQAERPDLQIVGWYHTHPGLGVFLSGTDMKTQQLHFRQPWQLAVVVDPIREEIGYFLGERGTRCSAVVFEQNAATTEPPSESCL